MIEALACENCGSGPVARYCASCGQRRLTDADLTTPGFLRDTFHELTSFDGRLWKTLIVLVRHPGQLSRDYFDGRGGRYLRPLNLFVLLNLVFFIIQPHTGLMRYDLANFINYDGDVAAMRRDRVNEKRVDPVVAALERHDTNRVSVERMDVFRARFDATLQDQKKSLLIVSIPLFALAMTLLYATSHRRYAEHLVFGVHVYAFFLLFAGVFITPAFIAVFWLLTKAGAPLAIMRSLETERSLIAVLFVAIGGYIYAGLRRMYGDSRIAAAVRAIVLFVVMQALVIAYHDVLFYTTLASL